MEDESKTAFKLQYCLIVKKISHLDGYIPAKPINNKQSIFEKVWITV